MSLQKLFDEKMQRITWFFQDNDYDDDVHGMNDFIRDHIADTPFRNLHQVICKNEGNHRPFFCTPKCNPFSHVREIPPNSKEYDAYICLKSKYVGILDNFISNEWNGNSNLYTRNHYIKDVNMSTIFELVDELDEEIRKIIAQNKADLVMDFTPLHMDLRRIMIDYLL